MANITNEQRAGLIRIIEENGRSAEFFEKFGKPVSAESRKEADAIVKELQALSKEEDLAYTKHQNEKRDLQSKLNGEKYDLDAKYAKLTEALDEKREKDNDTRQAEIRALSKKLKSLGFFKESDYVGDNLVYVATVDTSITNKEYEMFKKRALAGVWGAETLEAANKAIQKYLDLEK